MIVGPNENNINLNLIALQDKSIERQINFMCTNHY